MARLTLERAEEVFLYDGVDLRWAKSLNSRSVVGSLAGTTDKNGHRVVCIDGDLYMVHRVIWLLVKGAWPLNEIDHRDGVKANNRIDNLRDVTHRVNMQNERGARKNNGCLSLGVSFEPRTGKFYSRIRTESGRLHLGTFDTESEASQAYLSAKRFHHEGCTV